MANQPKFTGDREQDSWAFQVTRELNAAREELATAREELAETREAIDSVTTRLEAIVDIPPSATTDDVRVRLNELVTLLEDL